MRCSADLFTGSKPALMTCRWMMLAAGLLALCLQVMAQTLNPTAMQNIMRVSGWAADGTQSFVGTCLGFDPHGEGQPARPGHHASCPVCFTLAQSQGFAPVPADLVSAAAWVSFKRIRMPAPLPVGSLAAASFASRAPPTSRG
jgi:hypothetical protein